MRFGLVLGAGGVVGMSYHAGVLHALAQEGGIDPASADLIVGTSAGSVMGTLLRSAGMGFKNLVSVRTYLADPEYDEANVRMRVKYLGDHETSSTVVCCRLLDPMWKLEIEAMAAG